VPAETIKALEEAGFFRLLQPAGYGGLQADPLTFYQAVRMIASACGSTGWVASVVGVHPWQLGCSRQPRRRRSGAPTRTRGCRPLTRPPDGHS